MKKYFLFSLILLSVVSCTYIYEEPGIGAVNVEWQVIKLENESVVYGFYGDLDDYLLVSTIDNILRTTDNGNTWDPVLSTNESIANFMNLNGVIYAISNGKDYSSDDDGVTWKEESFNWEVYPRADQLNDSMGTLYHRVAHYEGELVLPSTILRSTNRGSSWEDIFPYQRAIGAIHIDQSDRLYLSSSGYTWNNDIRFFTEEPDFPAYIYYTEK